MDSLQADVLALKGAIVELSLLTHRQMVDDLRTFDLTLPQYLVMAAIKRQGRACTMSELAEAAYQISATMTGVVDRMVDRNLVERQRDADDRRVWRIDLTVQGGQLLQDVEVARQQRWRRVLSHLQPEERQLMIQLMQRYLEVMQGEYA